MLYEYIQRNSVSRVNLFFKAVVSELSGYSDVVTRFICEKPIGERFCRIWFEVVGEGSLRLNFGLNPLRLWGALRGSWDLGKFPAETFIPKTSTRFLPPCKDYGFRGLHDAFPQ